MKGVQRKKPGNQQPDHLEPTTDEERKPFTAPAQIKGLSEKELQDKTEVYSRVGNNMKRFFTFQKNGKDFRSGKQKTHDHRIQQDVHYAKGLRSGLQHSPHEVIKDDRDWKDQQARDEFMRKQKEEYDKEGMKREFSERHRTLGKSHLFNHAHNKFRDLGKDLDSDKEK